MVANNGPRIRTGSSRSAELPGAVEELARSLDQPEIGLVAVFAARRFDAAELARCLGRRFPDATVIGCTTAGEIGPCGYLDDSLSGFSVHRDDLLFEVGLLENLAAHDSHAKRHFAQALGENLRCRVSAFNPDNGFGFMLVDGMSGAEEVVARAFFDGLGGVPLVGGSAADGLAFGATRVFLNERCVDDAALLLVATTPFPFTLFKTQHFASSEERLVVTGAIPEKRVVTEINGCPAAEEYARALGTDVAALRPQVFAAHPVVVRIGNSDFVRSIRQANADGSLSFFCAIDEGIVFRLAVGLDMVENLEELLADIRQRVGPPALILSCDCILRHIEARQRNLCERIGTLLAEANAVGFSTYGEQYHGMHVNQTFTGVAFGGR